MLYRPSDLSAADEAAFEDHVRDLRERVLEHVEALLVDMDAPHLSQSVYDVAFAENDVVPKRESRPKLQTALLAEQTSLEFDPSGDRLAPLLRFTVAVQEYYDLLDDLIDGDVADGHENRVILVSQALVPALMRSLSALGEDATTYWTGRAFDLLTAPRFEAEADPTPEAYDELLDRQSHLFGFVTGLAAVATGRDEATVERAERLGRVTYRHAQYVLDYEQYHAGHEEGWNAVALTSADEVVERLERWRDEVATLTADYASERARLIRALVALDVEAWRRAVGG